MRQIQDSAAWQPHHLRCSWLLLSSLKAPGESPTLHLTVSYCHAEHGMSQRATLGHCCFTDSPEQSPAPLSLGRCAKLVFCTREAATPPSVTFPGNIGSSGVSEQITGTGHHLPALGRSRKQGAAGRRMPVPEEIWERAELSQQGFGRGSLGKWAFSVLGK